MHTAPCPSALAGCFWNTADSTFVACTFDHTVLVHEPKGLTVAKRFVGSFDEVTGLKYVPRPTVHVSCSILKASRRTHKKNKKIATM